MTGIRCDANSIIASGHMMRCLTIAKELVRLGESVTFFVADEESKAAFDSMASGMNGVTAVVLGSDWQNMEAELPLLGKELSANAIDILLVDSYYATPAYFERLKELCPVACFDDLHEDIYPVDILINYSGFYRELGYEDTYKNVTGYNGKPTKLLLGLGYAPLREQFHKTEDAAGKCNNADADGSTEKRVSILLASGGADAWGMLLGTLEAAKDNGLIEKNDRSPSAVTAFDWHVVAGALCKDSDALDAFAEAHPGVHIHHPVNDMAGLMRQCDLAVCAGGTMLTECAAVELPAVFYQVADNQKYNVEFFGNTGGMIFAGDVNKGQGVTSGICHIITAILEEDRLQDMRSALSGLTDGRGAVKIAGELIETER